MTDTRSEGLVYYVLDATRKDQYLKIGFTTRLRQRTQDLRALTSSGQVPLVLGLEEGGVRREHERHVQFAALRSHGEWFRYEGELAKHVAEMEHPFGFLLDRPHLWVFADGWGPVCLPSAARRPNSSRQESSVKEWDIDTQPLHRFPLRPGHTISAEGIELGPDGLPPIDF